jgi:hypothetical protein
MQTILHPRLGLDRATVRMRCHAGWRRAHIRDEEAVRTLSSAAGHARAALIRAKAGLRNAASAVMNSSSVVSLATPIQGQGLPISQPQKRGSCTRISGAIIEFSAAQPPQVNPFAVAGNQCAEQSGL